MRHRLTGDIATDPVDACGMALYDIIRQRWSPELVALAGIRSDQLPPVLDPTVIAGRLLPEPARLLGLSAAHTAADLRQTVLDGVAFSLRRMLDRVAALAGPQSEIRVGCAAGDRGAMQADGVDWLTRRATIYRTSIARLENPEPTALGAMLVAAAGTGMVASLQDAAAQTVRVAEMIEPDAALGEQMEKQYADYIRAEELVRAFARG